MSAGISSPILGIQADPLARLTPATDTTLYFVQIALLQGWRVFWFEPNNLRWEVGRVRARGA